MLWKVLVSLCVLIIVSLPAESLNWAPKSLIVFGAGTPDYGRSYQLYKIPISPPYWRHRFSNGPVYSELLAYKMNLIPDPSLYPDYWKTNTNLNFLSYAYFDATVTNKYIYNSKYTMTFNNEIDQYIKNKHPQGSSSLVIIDTDLAKNDMMSDQCRDHALECTNFVIDKIKDGMQKLCRREGVTHFMLIAPTGSHDSPYAVKQYKIPMRDKIGMFAANLMRSANGIADQLQKKCPGIDVDIFPLLTYENRWKQSYSIPVPDPCYNNMQDNDPVYDRRVGPVCDNPNKHFYFDVFFTSNSVNKLLADALYKDIYSFNWQKRSFWQNLRNFWDKVK